jgi:hypothetical protein
MIVSDDTVSKALAYLADDPHPVAVARKDVADAEDEAARVYSRLFLEAHGSIDARKAAALCGADHTAAKARLSEAVKEFEAHRSRVKAAEMIIEVWRSENANARAAERIR